MNNTASTQKQQDEIFLIISSLIKQYGSAEKALSEAQRVKAPRPLKNGKKVLLKMLRICVRNGITNTERT